MKPNEARNLNAEENKEAVAERREELLDLRFQAAVGQASNPRRIRAAKREIARLLTVAREKEQRK
ncbi:MAG: 50S ribosomal protein L29 [Trueperaceae bacterium]|jgi:large subunit ribosomal protein L29|nr:50S ribosomal protein L29 [Trueperaceae bacterium]